jgi:hypothetical protein
MVLLTLTEVAKAAVNEYCRLKNLANENDDNVERLSGVGLGSPVEHNDLIDISKFLVERRHETGAEGVPARQWRLDSLLRGAIVYQPPSAPKPEPVSLNEERVNGL